VSDLGTFLEAPMGAQVDQWTSGRVDQWTSWTSGPVDHPRDARESHLEVDLALLALDFLGLLPSVALHCQHV